MLALTRVSDLRLTRERGKRAGDDSGRVGPIAVKRGSSPTGNWLGLNYCTIGHLDMADQTALYEDYSNVLEQVGATPYDRALHLRHIELLSQLGLDDEVSSAIDLYASHFSIQPGTSTGQVTRRAQGWC
jgi:hypothetical protein